MKRMAGRQDALAVEARDHRRIQRLGEGHHPVGRQPGTAAGEHERRVGPGEQRGRPLDRGRIGGGRRDRGHPRAGIVGRRRQHVGQRLDHHRPRPGGDRRQRLIHGGRQRSRRPRCHVVAGDGGVGDALPRGFVHPAAAAGVAGDLRGDVQHPQVRGVGLAHAREGVEGARAGAGQAHPRPAGRPRVTDSGERRRLLVADDHRADPRPVERLPQRQRMLAGDAEHHLHAVRLERRDQRVRARPDGGRRAAHTAATLPERPRRPGREPATGWRATGCRPRRPWRPAR